MRIQLKRSSVLLQDGTAKPPSSEQMDYGELAVNFAKEDPSVFFKNSDNEIIRISGSGAVGVGTAEISFDAGPGLYISNPAFTLDQTTAQTLDVELVLEDSTELVGLEFANNKLRAKKATSAALGSIKEPNGIGVYMRQVTASGEVWVQKDASVALPSGYPDLSDGDGSTLDNRYLMQQVDQTYTGNRLTISQNLTVGNDLDANKINASGMITGDVTGDLTGNADTATNATNAANATNAGTAANLTRSVIAGDGLTGGGELTADRTLNITADDSTIIVGTDGIRVNQNALDFTAAANDGQININASNGLEATGNNATANQGGSTTRTISGINASTSAKGVVQLNDSVNSTSTTEAATPNAVKRTYDYIEEYAAPKSEGLKGLSAVAPIILNEPTGMTFEISFDDAPSDGGQYVRKDESWELVDVPPGTIISQTAPSGDLEDGQLWWADTTVDDGGGRMYIWTGDQWVDTSLPAGGGGLSQSDAEGLFVSTQVDSSMAGVLTANAGVVGNLTGDVTGDLTGDVTGDVTGNAGSATKLETARKIGGVSFNGTADIDLPGVNKVGNQNTTGNAATATNATNADNATNAGKLDGVSSEQFLRSDVNDTADGVLTLNGKVNFRTGADFGDADYIYMGSSDDWQVSFNSNGWLYINQLASGIIFQDNGTNKMRLEDSGVFRPETTNTGTIGTSTVYWDNGFFQDFNVSSVLNVRGAIDLADNDVLRLGSGDDAELFCNGSHLYLDLNSGIGNFYIRDGSTTRYTFDDNGTLTCGTINAAISTANVNNAVAGTTAGTKGSYNLLQFDGDQQAFTPNSTLSGGSLRYTNCGGNRYTGSRPGGSYRLLGRLGQDPSLSDPERASLFVRYA